MEIIKYVNKINKIRSDFFFLKNKIYNNNFIYLDNASTTQKPLQVLNSVNAFYKSYCSNINRSSYYISELSYKKFELSRKRVKFFLNANYIEEILFTNGATDSINIISNYFAREFLKEGDNIIISSFEHHSNISPWQILAKEKKVFLRFINFNISGIFDLNIFKKCFDKKTKLVIISHISNVIGIENPVEEICKISHTNNSLVIIDGSQAVSHCLVDVKKIDADFYFFSSHKMYSSMGVGILYIKIKILEQIKNFKTGGGNISSLLFNKITYKVFPFKYEAGTQNISSVISIYNAIDYILNIGIDFIDYHEKKMVDYLISKLINELDIKILGNINNKKSIVTFIINNIHPHDLCSLFDRESIMVRTGFLCAQPTINRYNISSVVRVSFGVYNNFDEIDILVYSLKKIRKYLYV